MVGCGVGVLLWVFSCLVKWPGISLFGRYGYPHVSVLVGCGGVVVGLDEVGEISFIGGGLWFHLRVLWPVLPKRRPLFH